MSRSGFCSNLGAGLKWCSDAEHLCWVLCCYFLELHLRISSDRFFLIASICLNKMLSGVPENALFQLYYYALLMMPPVVLFIRKMSAWLKDH